VASLRGSLFQKEEASLKRLFSVLLSLSLLAVILPSLRADDTKNLSVTVNVSELLALTLGVTSITITPLMPPDEQIAWAPEFTAQAEINASGTEFRVMVSGTTMVSGSNSLSPQWLRIQGTGDFARSPIDIPPIPTQRFSWATAGTKTGTIQIGYNNTSPAPNPGSYSGIVSFTLTKS